MYQIIKKCVCVCIIYKKLAGSVSQLLGIFSVLCHIFIDIYTYTYNKQNSIFNGWTLCDEVLFMYIEDCIILEQTDAPICWHPITPGLTM